jgi:uncharacterized protein (TIGR02466 family)
MINTIFPVPIYESNINCDLEQQVIDFLYQQSLGQQQNSHKSFNSFVGYNSNDKILDLPILADLKLKIESEIKNFVEQYGMDENYWYIGKSWLTVTLPGGCINMHNHIGHGSILSGVFYVDTPEDCGDIIFTNPYPFRDRMPFKIINDINSAYFRKKPVKNTLMLWPSSLNHQTDVNLSGENRLSIGVDVFHVIPNIISPLKKLLGNIDVS